LCEKEVFKEVGSRLSPEDFMDGIHRGLAEIIFDTMRKGERVNPMTVISQFEEKDIGAVSEILSDDKNVDNKIEAAKLPLKTILAHKQKQQEKVLTKDGDTAKLQEIMEKLKKDKM
jgi:hypothetical protein